jgi:hypothetical protein
VGDDGQGPLRRSGSPSIARRGGRAIAASLPAPELGGYRAEHLAIAARAWTLRAEEEYRSASVFAEIVAAGLDTGAPVDVVGAIARIVDDEIAHATLCLDLASRFGAPAPVASPGRVRGRLATFAPDRALQALSLLLFEGAVGESVSVRLFRAGRRASREPCTRAALGAIMRDEARHATVSWLASAELYAALPAASREALAADLSRGFGAFERAAALPALQNLDAGRQVDPALRELGVLSYEDRVEAFYAGIERVALPRLSRLGFDAQRLWADRYRG